jgi:hypothetical protein
MKKVFVSFLLGALLCAMPTFANQHGRSNHGGRSHDSRGDHDRHGRDHDRNMGREQHRRIDHRDIRWHGGRQEVFFGGIWFGCEVWPPWVFSEEIYFENVDGIYFVYSYAHPGWFVQVSVIE